jgi:hypothetical protein
VKQARNYHQKLRETYSRFLREKLFADEDLKCLSQDDLELLFDELTKWFGTSPPETSKVMEDLQTIIEDEINFQLVNLGDD